MSRTGVASARPGGRRPARQGRMTPRSRLVGALLAATVLLGGLAACSTTPGAVTDVDVAESTSILTEPGITVLDVRTPAEFAAGHLPGAVNIDIEGGAFSEQIADLPKDGEYFVYCRSGNRSGVATDEMADAGFTKLYDLQGGVGAWQAAGGALVTD